MIKKENGILFRIVALILVCLLLDQAHYIFCRENVDTEIDQEFNQAKEDYIKGKRETKFYMEAKAKLDRLEVVLESESNTSAKIELLKKVYLLNGAVHEKLKELNKAKDKYQKINGTIKIEGINLKDLPLYTEIVLKKVIVEEGDPPPKKKKFPVLLVAGIVVVVVVAIILLSKKKKSPPTPAFVTSQDSLNVPEGGTASFDVRLSAQPSADVSVSVTRVDGDTDITVQSGSNLTFTRTNWNQNQTVTLAAGEDIDTTNDSAVIRISGTGIQNKDLTVTEQENDVLSFVTDQDVVYVKERKTNTFTVWLSNQPTANVQASVTWVSGDSDISVESGGSLNFTTSNWNIAQPVVLRAAEDDDTANSPAVIRISADGVQTKDITAIEDDNDIEECNISVDITSPSNNATVSGTVPIQALVTGNCEVDRVEFYIDGDIKETDTSEPYSYDWNTATALVGPHILRVVAYSTTNKNAESDIIVTVTR